jgi:hypothetical protein
LGWLSVDADECPSHVFRVTEADRLRDACDGFVTQLPKPNGIGTTNQFSNDHKCAFWADFGV